MTRTPRMFVLAVLLGAFLAAAAPVSGRRLTVHDGERTRAAVVEVSEFDGITYFRLADLAAVLGLARHWDPETLGMTLTGGGDRVDLSAGNQFAAVSDSLVNMRRPVLLRRGSFWVPPTLITRVLAPAANVLIEWDLEERTFTVTQLAPVVSSVAFEPRDEGTAVVVGLSAPARFSVSSSGARGIRMFLPKAALPDSLYIPDGTGVISGVTVDGRPGGVRLHVAVGGNAGSYRADRYMNPDRIEILIRKRSEADIPVPALRDAMELLPSRDDVFGGAGSGIETVMIDPGHGGGEAGTGVGTTTPEKDVTLALARTLSDELQRRGFYVFMTRSGDSAVPLRRRAEIANLAMADVFVSLQCGAWYSGAARGFQVYYHRPPEGSAGSGMSTTGGLIDEKTQGRGAGAGLLWAGEQEKHVGESRSLALSVHRRLADSLSTPARSVSGANLVVLAGCAMPAVLVEAGYLTNRSDSGLLNDESSRREIARAIAAGILDYAHSVGGREP